MHRKTALAQTIRKTIVAATATAAPTRRSRSVTQLTPHAPKGPFNCELGYNTLPDDRWSSCAAPGTVDYCDLGEYLLPDDRWAPNCLPS